MRVFFTQPATASDLACVRLWFGSPDVVSSENGENGYTRVVFTSDAGPDYLLDPKSPHTWYLCVYRKNLLDAYKAAVCPEEFARLKHSARTKLAVLRILAIARDKIRRGMQ